MNSVQTFKSIRGTVDHILKELKKLEAESVIKDTHAADVVGEEIQEYRKELTRQRRLCGKRNNSKVQGHSFSSRNKNICSNCLMERK